MRNPLRLIWSIAAVYVAIGLATSALSNTARPGTREAWRIAAWLISFVVFAAQVAYDRRSLGATAATAAKHAASSVAIATFALALAGPVRTHWGDSSRGPLLSVVLWPLLSGVASFVVALVAATLLPPKSPTLTDN